VSQVRSNARWWRVPSREPMPINPAGLPPWLTFGTPMCVSCSAAQPAQWFSYPPPYPMAVVFLHDRLYTRGRTMGRGNQHASNGRTGVVNQRCGSSACQPTPNSSYWFGVPTTRQRCTGLPSIVMPEYLPPGAGVGTPLCGPDGTFTLLPQFGQVNAYMPRRINTPSELLLGRCLGRLNRRLCSDK
jgi:hypothetical protein